MKKITPREMKWINKGNYKNLSYNRIEAKGKNSFLYAISDEDFSFSSTHQLNNNNYSIFVSISDITYIKLNIQKNPVLIISIKGSESKTIINNNSYNIENKINITLVRKKNSFYLTIEDQKISEISLPAANDAISFGFLFNNNEFAKINDIKYLKI